jgi:hypothetical protein
MRRLLAATVCTGLCAALSACRNSSGTAPGALTIIPNAEGQNGCSGPDQAFAPPQTPAVVPLATLVIGPASQVTAASSGELLYATGDGASVVAIDVSGAPPVEVVLVPSGSGPGTVAELLVGAGIATAPVLSGIAVLDAAHLVAVEQTSNTLITLLRLPPNTVAFYAGQPNETPGLADGPASLARFSFGIPSQVCPTGDAPPKVFVADASNHAIRLVQADSHQFLQVSTIAGHGLPGSFDGDLRAALFDTPTGLSAACTGALIVSERGGNGFGHLIRQLEIGQPSPFGGYLGTATTLVGDGTDATTGGIGTAAEVSQPVSPLVTSQGEIYWIDSGSGVLRRRKLDETVDCPLAADCPSAVLSPSFTPGNVFSLTETAGGILYVMDATAGVLYRVTP